MAREAEVAFFAPGNLLLETLGDHFLQKIATNPESLPQPRGEQGILWVFRGDGQDIVGRLVPERLLTLFWHAQGQPEHQVNPRLP